MVTQNIISNRIFLNILNYSAIVLCVILFVILILGLIRRFHNFDVFDKGFENHVKDMLYIGIPIIIIFVVLFIINTANVVFFVDAIKHEDESVSKDNILHKPQLHVALNIVALIITLPFIAFFVFTVGFRLVGSHRY